MVGRARSGPPWPRRWRRQACTTAERRPPEARYDSVHRSDAADAGPGAAEDVPTEIDIQPIKASTVVVELPGASTGLPTVSWQGSDANGGAGIGTGPRRSGAGGGSGDGIGTGAFGAGTGVMMPTLVTEVKPSYTAEAMRAKVQGAVLVEAIVRQDGSVGQVRILRSLDRTFGLDEEALKAVRNWRFRPGRREGRNVAVIVEIELMFTLR